MNSTPDALVDAIGLICPVPIIRLAQAAKELGSGVVELMADDPATRLDVAAWCGMRSATLLSTSEERRGEISVFRYLIQVGPDPVESNSAGPGRVGSEQDRAG